MKIKYTTYPDGIHDLDFTETAKDLGLPEPFVGEVKLSCRMDKSSSQIVLTCDAAFSADFICDRCTENFISDLNSNFILVKVFDPELTDPEDSNIEYLPSDVTVIDLKPDLTELLKISLPMKRLCSDDCAGLCPGCGANLNHEKCSCKNEAVNPVWNDLLKIKDKLNN